MSKDRSIDWRWAVAGGIVGAGAAWLTRLLNAGTISDAWWPVSFWLAGAPYSVWQALLALVGRTVLHVPGWCWDAVLVVYGAGVGALFAWQRPRRSGWLACVVALLIAHGVAAVTLHRQQSAWHDILRTAFPGWTVRP